MAASLGDHLGIGFEAGIGQVRGTIAVRAPDVVMTSPTNHTPMLSPVSAKGLHHADERILEAVYFP